MYCTSCLVRWKEHVELSSGSNSRNFAVPKLPSFPSDEALQIGRLLTSWFQLGKFFLLLKIYLLWKIWLISVKQWKSVWIHACIWSCLFSSGSNNLNFAVPILPVYQPDITIVFKCLFYFISDLAFKNALTKIMVNEKQTNSMENGSRQTSHDQACHLGGNTFQVSNLCYILQSRFNS